MGVLKDVMRSEIIEDMSEGVMLLGLNGVIEYINPAAERILDIPSDGCANKKLGEVFFEHQENEGFVQLILDAVYDTENKHASLVPFSTDSRTRHLRVQTSYLTMGAKKAGVIVVLDDLTELAELKIEYTEKIARMLDSFVQALATAIEERSNYNANHTLNMVRMATAFMNWLDETHQAWHFDDIKRRAFLMSVWMHDVGKLVVPLEIMDKATRLGTHITDIDARFDRIHLLNRIRLLEGKISQEAYENAQEENSRILRQIHRLDGCGFLSDADLEMVLHLTGLTYTEEDGTQKPLLTEKEKSMLLIRKGTLTDEERLVMQSHVSVTRKILSQVRFPEEYAVVTEWASAHHEFLNGTGYPDHKTGEAIPREVRLLTILDIFEALTATDRPYKKQVPVAKAFAILHEMALEGCIDETVLALFEESHAWEEVAVMENDCELHRLSEF